MRVKTFNQHRKPFEGHKQTVAHIRASLAGKAAERKVIVTLPTLNIITLEEIEAKYGKS